MAVSTSRYRQTRGSGHTAGFPRSAFGRSFGAVFGSPYLTILWLLALSTSLLVLVPPGYLLLRSLDAGSDLWPLVFRERTLLILRNTVGLGLAVGIGGILIAVPLAWLTTRTDLPFRRFWSVVAPLPLVIPSYAGALAVIGTLGPRGLVQHWLEPLGIERLPSIYGFPGAAMTLILFTYPYVYLTARAALLGLDPGTEEASRSLGRGRWRTLLTCTLPQLQPSIGAGALLAVLYAMSDFGVVTLMRFDVFTRVIYTQYRSAFDRSLASALGVMLIVLAAAVLWGEYRLRRRGSFYRLGSGAARRQPTVQLGRWRWLAAAWCALIAILSLGVPLATLGWWATAGSSAATGLDGLPSLAANSVALSVLAALATVSAALPIAILAVRSQARLAAVVSRLTYLGFAVPGIAIGLAFVFLGARYLTPLYQTLPFLILALTIRHLAQSVGATQSALAQVNPRLEEAARALGRSPLATLRHVTLPLVWPGVASGALLVLITVLKELPITLLLGPTGFGTVATGIWSATGAGQYGRAATGAMVLILLTIPPTLLLGGRLSRRRATAFR